MEFLDICCENINNALCRDESSKNNRKQRTTEKPLEYLGKMLEIPL